jgi:hypothetical protein
MNATATFDEVLDAIERMSDERQADLVNIVRKRMAERGRQQLVESVKQARAEHAAGLSRPATVAEIMREINS